jgi:predicted transcriptional regulator
VIIMAVSRLGWRWYTDPGTVCRRAGGRRRYNAQRQRAMLVRRLKVLALALELGHGRGVQAEIARLLGVSQATISRDLAAARRFPARRNDDLTAADAAIRAAAAKAASTPADVEREVVAIERRARWANLDAALDAQLDRVVRRLLDGRLG